MPDPKKPRIFDMRGGPADGILFKLYDGAYPGQPDSKGWDEVPWGELGRYVRPSDVNPEMERKGKPNKKRSNIPHMVWEASV